MFTVEAGIYLATAIAVAQVRDHVAREQVLSAQVSHAYDAMSHEVESAGLLQREFLSQGAMYIPLRGPVHANPQAHVGHLPALTTPFGTPPRHPEASANPYIRCALLSPALRSLGSPAACVAARIPDPNQHWQSFRRL